MAKETGISVSSLSAYERDKRTPKIEALARLSFALDVSISDLQDSSSIVRGLTPETVADTGLSPAVVKEEARKLKYSSALSPKATITEGTVQAVNILLAKWESKTGMPPNFSEMELQELPQWPHGSFEDVVTAAVMNHNPYEWGTDDRSALNHTVHSLEKLAREVRNQYYVDPLKLDKAGTDEKDCIKENMDPKILAGIEQILSKAELELKKLKNKIQ